MIRSSRFSIWKLLFIMALVVGPLVCAMTHSEVVGYYDAEYTESAHGQHVNRQDMSEYMTGNCAHCHEQHASLNGNEREPYAYMLFAPNNADSQDDNFCFHCHRKTGSVQDGSITNFPYSNTFGGEPETGDTYTSIYEVFNPTQIGASSHNLMNIQDFITGRWGFTHNSNPCDACHNPHYALKNYPVAINERQGVNTAVKRPSQNQDEPRNLWGDECQATSGVAELMSEYAGAFGRLYQAPYYYDASPGPSKFEPAGNNEVPPDGRNLPNFVQVCLPCHDYSMPSTRLGRITRVINWTIDGDSHGRRAAELDAGWAELGSPYGMDDLGDYLLSCTDCHEPHGSPNQFLLRTCVNGKAGIRIPFVSDQDGFWWDFCTACHVNIVAHAWTQGRDPTQVDCFQNVACHAHGRSPMF